jgi:hypothetical protein
MANMGRWILSGVSMAVVMTMSYGLFLTVAEKNTDEIREKFRTNRNTSEHNNEFARVIFGKGPADLVRMLNNFLSSALIIGCSFLARFPP